MCTTRKIEGMVQFGCSWAIHRNADKSADGLITKEEYKNCRNKSKNDNTDIFCRSRNI